MSAIREQTWTVEKYLAFERESEQKHEFLDGEVIAFAGASWDHNLIVASTLSSLHPQLAKPSCKICPSDIRVKVSPRVYVYPDIVIVCGTPQFEDGSPDTVVNPSFLVEVLSPSTEAHDRGKKSQEYRTLESLQEYVLISQDSLRVERYTRHESGEWRLTDATGMDGVLALKSIQCTLRLADVYIQVTFDNQQH